MLEMHSAPAQLAARDLQRQIDRSVSRALVDHEYARHLLADPTVLLEDRGCSPQQYLHLRSIRAESLPDFARQAHALFWLDQRADDTEHQLTRPAAAAL